MPRAFAKVNVAIWQDPDFRRLPPAAQHLYLLLWTSPSLSFCGVHDWRPGRLSHLSQGFTEEHTKTVADCLTARHFIVVDHETEEVLIRSWARHDEVLKQPRLAVSFVHAYADTYSATLRSVLVYELSKIQKKSPSLTCWKDSRVTDLLDHEAVSAKDLPVPQDPFDPEVGDGFGPGFALGLAQTSPKVWPWVWVPPTTAATDSTNQTSDKKHSAGKPAKAKARPLPSDWVPTDEHKQRAAKSGVALDREVQKFKAHAEANDRKVVVWNAAFTQWLIQAEERAGSSRPTPVRHLPTVDELELPPDGLSEVAYAAWEREARERRAAR